LETFFPFSRANVGDGRPVMPETKIEARRTENRGNFPGRRSYISPAAMLGPTREKTFTTATGTAVAGPRNRLANLTGDNNLAASAPTKPVAR